MKIEIDHFKLTIDYEHRFLSAYLKGFVENEEITFMRFTFTIEEYEIIKDLCSSNKNSIKYLKHDRLSKFAHFKIKNNLESITLDVPSIEHDRVGNPVKAIRHISSDISEVFHLDHNNNTNNVFCIYPSLFFTRKTAWNLIKSLFFQPKYFKRNS